MNLKKQFSKKYAGIPLFVVIVLVVAMTGAAAAGYMVFNDSGEADVEEVVSVSKTNSIGDLEPGATHSNESDVNPRYQVEYTGTQTDFPVTLQLTITDGAEYLKNFGIWSDEGTIQGDPIANGVGAWADGWIENEDLVGVETNASDEPNKEIWITYPVDEGDSFNAWIEFDVKANAPSGDNIIDYEFKVFRG